MHHSHQKTILGRGGQIYLKCPLLLKISRIELQSRGHGVSKFKLGHMGPNKKGFGSKDVLGLAEGPAKLIRQKIWGLEFWIFLLWTKIWDPKSRIWFSFGLHLQNICSHGPNKKDLRSFAQKMTKLEHFSFGPAEFTDIWDFSNIADFHGFWRSF